MNESILLADCESLYSSELSCDVEAAEVWRCFPAVP